MDNTNTFFVPVFKALGDETRLKIIKMLASGEMCACRILREFNITQPTLSYHMKILIESGLVNGVREGAWMRYTLNVTQENVLKLFLEQLFKAEVNNSNNEAN